MNENQTKKTPLNTPTVIQKKLGTISGGFVYQVKVLFLDLGKSGHNKWMVVLSMGTISGVYCIVEQWASLILP